ncbi:4-galactosyl-N-acetylglucosaminide 3-alpha-L-fucosyltransferase 9-like isoform X1 [Clavelina lepadiformis]|uniref:4-galactosyl-N-acetylglucosaminide 3-alpha-L-fucosyltransferase 9-like isoform X1 n=1 Tax=Clavelina lepadiformis TaxID=159417 RepID=UPI0040428541
MRSKTYCVLGTVVLFNFLYVFWLYQSMGHFDGSKTNNFQATSFNARPIAQPAGELLLFWGRRWGGKESWPPEGYKFGKCVATYERKYISKARAVIFHFTTLNDKDFPWTYYRANDQLYIFWNAETPGAVRKELSNAGTDVALFESGFFNWSMTYRTDADVYWGYGYRGDLLNYVSRGKDAVDIIIKSKKKLAVWITSNCKYTDIAKVRMEYVQAMEEFGLQITKLGKCFGSYLEENEKYQIIKEHKFYLAFENAMHCRDYISEKFWDNSLKSDSVPIVMGPVREDLLKVAPIDSYIYAEDYDSAAELVQYLLYLDENEEEYRKYFRWREDMSLTDDKMIATIEEKHPDIKPMRRPKGLCDAVLENKDIKVINSLTKVLVANDPEECLNSVH